jgi:hypothetical protein
MTLEEEEQRLNQLLVGSRVARISRRRPREIVIEFENGARLFVDAANEGGLECSVTGDFEADT